MSQANNEKTTIFFSYSRADQAKALPVIQAIEAAGFKVWWDGMLEVGSTFLETTEEALETASAVVVLWSKTSVASHWVRDEATSGRERSRLVPLSLDGTIPPLGFRQVQFIDIQSWSGDPNAPSMLELYSVLEELHGRPARTPEERAKALTKAQKPKIGRRNVLIGGGVAALGIAGGGAFLGGLFTPSPKALANSIGVLPFSNLTGQDQYNYIAEGLSSEIRNSLSQNQAFKVAARSSSIAVKSDNLDVSEISQKLNVANIIEGEINVISDFLRVNITFVEGSSGFTRWAKNFEHPVDDILRVHDEITRVIHDTFSLTYGNADSSKIGQTENPAAFNEYLKGETLVRQSLSADNIDTAISYYDAALTLDPRFSAALISKSQLQYWKGVLSYDSIESLRLRQQAIQTAKMAVDVAPDYNDAYSNLGDLYFNGILDIGNARAAFEKGRELGDTRSSALARFARFATFTGQHEEALKAAQQAVDLDPLNLAVQEILAFAHLAAARYEEALTVYLALKVKQNNRVLVNARIADIYTLTGQFEQSIPFCEAESYELAKETCLALTHIQSGDLDKAEEKIALIEEKFGDYAAYQLTQVYASKNDIETAIVWLNKAHELNDSALIQFYIDPFLENIRNQPEFKALLAKTGFVE